MMSDWMDTYEDRMSEGHVQNDNCQEVELEIICVKHETEKAWLMSFEYDSDFGEDVIEKWFPKSQCEFDGDINGGTLTIPNWLYNSLIDEE
jgi:hypothetical protein